MNNDYTVEEWRAQFKERPMSRRRAQQLCQKEEVKGAYQRGGMYWIPRGAPDPRGPLGRPPKRRRKQNAAEA